MIHAYLDWQNSPEEINRLAEAGRTAARKRWASEAQSEPHADRMQKKKREEEASSSKMHPGRGPGARPTRAVGPPPWVQGEEQLPEAIRNLISAEGFNPSWVEAQRLQMLDWALANGKTYKDWEAGFRNWLRRSAEEARSQRGQVGGEDVEAALREWLRVHPCPVPAELEPLEAEDATEFQRRMQPVRQAHRERGLAEVRRRGMRSVQ